ncbi:MAG TPA: ASPIC/UnbV domain-containing protein, partial [Vicinamibacteria bacterium]|nr:ASPIC/UnbV domain-containing protein [Vicinamibacteria bacterium]
LVGRASNRDGIGARVRVDAGDNEQIDELRCGYSYLSMHDLRIHFGLGIADRIDRLEIRWPSGLVQSYSDLTADRIVLLKEGLEGIMR